jgi:hypothetical protein
VDKRLLAATAMLAVLAAGWLWVASLAPHAGAAVANVSVAVVGPDGTVGPNGTVAEAASPLDAVQELGRQKGFPVVVEEQPWVGSGCTAHYVVAIAGWRETSTGGWNYYTRPSPGASWTWQAAGAACYALHAGEQVEWCWVEQDVCRHHAT